MIYLDHNATTPPHPDVVAAMREVLETSWGNPSSTHRFGQQARAKLELARQEVARLLGASTHELVFTSGGSEADNWAILGLLCPALGGPAAGGLVTAATEHSAVRTPAKDLEAAGVPVEWVDLQAPGVVAPEALRAAVERLAPRVLAAGGERMVVSLMWANNETGLVSDIPALSAVVADLRPALQERGLRLFFHVDAVQALGKLPVHPGAVGADLASISAHKIHGPKGMGALWLRRGVKPAPRQRGGAQEKGQRPGTEDIAGVVGFGVAARLAAGFLADPAGIADLAARRDAFERAVLAALPDAVVNAAGHPRLANTSSIGFPRLEAEAILVGLSEQGVCASAGSACSSGSIEASPVLLAAGIPEDIAHGTVRFSLSRETAAAELERAAATVAKVVNRLRRVTA